MWAYSAEAVTLAGKVVGRPDIDTETVGSTGLHEVDSAASVDLVHSGIGLGWSRHCAMSVYNHLKC